MRILQLEVQVCKLEAYNEDLSAKLWREQVEVLKEDDDLSLDVKPMEPPRMNARIDQSFKLNVVENL